MPVPPAEVEVVEPAGFARGDPVWDVPWLKSFRRMPSDATWPRLMTVPHPRAVDSVGPRVAEWVRRRRGKPWRWWQKLAAARALEVDADGRLVWEDVGLTVARQVGKTWWLADYCGWRLEQGGRFGAEQLVLSTGKDLDVVREMQRPARNRAKGYPDRYLVREVNGQESIECLDDGSRWMVRSKDGVYGKSASLATVDEAWKVPANKIDDGLVPTMVEQPQSQLLLVSTAHRLATALMMGRRATALAELGAPPDNGILWIEWSAPRDAPVDDRGAWRMASPSWTPRREALIEKRLKAALDGESDDPDEPDPMESFRAQWLNQWPAHRTLQGVGDVLVSAEAWAACPAAAGSVYERLWVAVADNYGDGAAVAAVALLDDDRLEVDGWLCGSRGEAVASARQLVDEQDPAVFARILVDKAIPAESDVDRAGSAETKVGLPLIRSLLAAGRIVHDDCPDVDAQIAAVRVREVTGGLSLLAGERSDVVRALAWAVLAACVRQPVPSIVALSR